MTEMFPLNRAALSRPGIQIASRRRYYMTFRNAHPSVGLLEVPIFYHLKALFHQGQRFFRCSRTWRLHLSTQYSSKMSSGASFGSTRPVASSNSAFLRDLGTGRPYHVEAQQLTKLAARSAFLTEVAIDKLICDEWFRG